MVRVLGYVKHNLGKIWKEYGMAYLGLLTTELIQVLENHNLRTGLSDAKCLAGHVLTSHKIYEQFYDDIVGGLEFCSSVFYFRIMIILTATIIMMTLSSRAIINYWLVI
jgi:hypothetical protein